ncbi:hypothetical protein VaNZ11_004823, partial [Volvox africanus]
NFSIVRWQARLEVFGAVKACRLVMDKASGKPKGTAFVEFREDGSADKAAAACARGRRNEGPGITLSGRQLEVDLAVTGEDARSLATQRLHSKTASKDRRNLYLAKEGHITEGSPAWHGMSAHDQAKRKRAAEEKNTKMKSPNFVISRTRLSVRNIPPGWTEAKLRKMFVEAVRERATKESPRVVQAKILREQDRYDASGARKSKGLGFVEFESHDHALAALRQLNNNPGTPWGGERRPIVEFAIDNVKVLKKIEHFKEKAKMRQQQLQQQQGREDGTVADGDSGARERLAADAEGMDKPRKGGKRERVGGRTAEGGVAAAAAGAGRGQQHVRAEKASAAAITKKDAGKEANGNTDGNTHGAATLSKRQRKRQRQKERVDRKKALLKEGGVKALVAAVEEGRMTKKAGGGVNGDMKEVHDAKGVGVPRGSAHGRPRDKAATKQQQQQHRKRRAEEEGLDRIAREGLVAMAATRGSAPHPKRRRRGIVEEGEEGGSDRLDKLSAQYRAKLSGERPGKRSAPKPSYAKNAKAYGGKGQGKKSGG